MDNFTNIGKAVLIQALGIQQNYTTIIDSSVEVTDYSNDNCSTCKYKAIIESFSSDNDIYKMAIDNCSKEHNKSTITNNHSGFYISFALFFLFSFFTLYLLFEGKSPSDSSGGFFPPCGKKAAV